MNFDLLLLSGLIMMWRHFGLLESLDSSRLYPNIINISCYWITFENHVKFTTVNLQINWYFKLMPNLKFIKPLLIHTYVLITLLGLIIGHSSSDNNKVRRRYDILDEALNSITVILPTKYLWFSDGRLGFKQSQREMKWTQNYPVLSVLYGRHLV